MKAFLYRNRYRFLWIIPAVFLLLLLFPGKREFEYYATGVQFEQKEKHLEYRDALRAGKKVKEELSLFGWLHGHEFKRGDGAVLVFWYIDHKRTSDIHDNSYEKISIEVPAKLIENGGEVDLAANRDVLLFYGKGLYAKQRCFDYPDNGILKVSKVEDGRLSVFLKFKVRQRNESGLGCYEEAMVEKAAVLKQKEIKFK